ncbi:MAG TPA: hypothetical protein VMY99_05345 [Nevskiaceae bacterium]|nr:hypothetical protein [Nevskiaceae bacterium]
MDRLPPAGQAVLGTAAERVLAQQDLAEQVKARLAAETALGEIALTQA